MWKDGKLKSIKRIIEGAENALGQIDLRPVSAVVYHYFGRRLTDRINEPLIDQHSARAHRLILNQDPTKVHKIRQSGPPTAEEAEACRAWFKQVVHEERVTVYKDTRTLDCFLFALGSYAKLDKQ